MITGIIVASALLLFWFYKRRTRDELKSLPGPKGSWFFGNIAELNPGEVVHMKLAEWAKDYGPVYKIRLMSRPVVVVTGQKEIYEVLVKKGKDFAGRGRSFRIDVMMENGSDMLSLDYTPMQQFRRRILQGHLKQYGEGVRKIEDITANTLRDVIADLMTRQNEPLDMTQIIQSAIIDITYTLVLGKKQDSVEEREAIVKLSKHMSDILSSSGTGIFLDILPWLRFFRNETYSKLMDMRSIRQRLFATWKRDLDNGDADADMNVIHKMFRMMEKGEELTETNIEILTMILFLGATSTTVTTFSCLLNILAHKPEIQERLQKEVDREIGQDGSIRLKDRARLPFHYAVILETLRYTTVLPLGIPHKTLCETTISGHRVPANCSVWTNLWGLHHDPEIWGDPEDFRPERFMGEDGQVIPPDHPLRQALMPFSAGPRVCLGEMFAQTRMFLLLSMLMQRLHVLPQTTIDAQPSYRASDMKLGGVLFPNEFRVRVLARD